MLLSVTTVVFLGNETFLHYYNKYKHYKHLGYASDILFSGTLHQSALHKHDVGIVENLGMWQATVIMRASATRVEKLDIVLETAQTLSSQLETQDSATIATSQGILQLTAQMTKHARIAGKQAT